MMEGRLSTVAGAFHKSYHHHRAVGEDADLTRARIGLCHAVKAVLRNGLTILGFSAPE